MPEFRLPDLGEGLTEAEIITWLVAIGDEVVVDQPVVEVETAKAAVEVPIPFAGRVNALYGVAGEKVAVGSPLIGVDPADASAARSDGALTDAATDAVSSEYSGQVLIGYGTSAEPVRRRRGPALRLAGPVAAADTDPIEVPAAKSSGSVSVISPVVRRLAIEHGVDLGELRPTDPSGVLRRHDVEAAIENRVSVSVQSRSEPDRIPLTGVRRTMADTLSRSRREIPEATVWVDVDATNLLATRRTLNAAAPDRPVSVLALLARFCVLGLQRYRELNSRVTADAVELQPAVNLGFAAQTDRGLMVPVIPAAQTLTTRELSAALADRTERARAGRLRPTELSGGTFTVNNYGVFGVDGSAAIINHPEVAILGMGRIMDRAWVVDGELTVRKVTELTLAFDHRACDGGVAGGFLRFVADCVENPVTALGEL